jgi:cell division initiation protein
MMSEENTNLTPLDISKKQFSTSFRGFDVNEVETFLEMMTEELETMIRKNEELKESLVKREREIKEIKDRESSMRKTLEGLQQVLTDERARAEEKGKQVIREAELTASEVLMKSKEEQSALKNDIRQLKRTRREFLAKVGSLIDSYKKIIEQDQQSLDAEINVDSDVQMI